MLEVEEVLSLLNPKGIRLQKCDNDNTYKNRKLKIRFFLPALVTFIAKSAHDFIVVLSMYNSSSNK